MLDRLQECTRTHRALVLVVEVVPNSTKVLVFRFFSHANRTPEIQVIICFLEVFAPCGEKLRVRRYHDTVKPTWKKKQKCKADVSCEKCLKNPEHMRLKYISKKAEGQSKTSCNVVVSASMPSKKKLQLTARKGQWPSTSRVVHQVFCGSATRLG